MAAAGTIVWTFIKMVILAAAAALGIFAGTRLRIRKDKKNGTE